MAEPKDRRSVRTRASLRDALLGLAEEHDLAAITVQQVVDRANVGRATFYLHYRNREELIDEVFDLLFVELTTASKSLEKAIRVGEPVREQLSEVNLYHLLDERRALYRRLFRSRAGSDFADRLETFHEQEFIEIWTSQGCEAAPGSPSMEFRACFAASATRGVINLWLEQGDDRDENAFGAWSQHIALYLLFDLGANGN
jgi:AcrR family transcriptional regulator